MKAIISEMVKTWGDVIKEFEDDILPKLRADRSSKAFSTS